MRVADYLEIAAQRYPDREGFVLGDRRITFGEARHYVHAIANRLLAVADLPRNAHIGILSQNDVRVTLLQLGISYAGFAWVSLHDRNTAEVNAQVIDFADCDVLVFHDALDASVPILKERCPRIREWLCINGPSPHGVALDDWIAEHRRPCPYRPTVPDDLAFIAPTGGTTGPSKGACHTHRNAEIEAVHISAAHFLGRENVRLLTVAPLSHVAGHLALALLPIGGTSVILNGFDAEKVLECIERERISHLFLPPTALYSLMAHPKCRQTDFSSLQILFVGAAPIAPEKFKEALSIFGPVIWEGFGQTETLIPILIKRPADFIAADGTVHEGRLRSCGRAWDFIRVEIMDEKGNLLPRGERGEIVVRSGFVMQGYYKNEAATREASAFGFHHTGDVGVMDEDGFVTIVDRKKDMIITGGFNVFPAEVEAVVNEHPDVLDCIVIGVPDERWGEAIKAVVQLKADRTVDGETLREYCRTRLGGVKAPKSVEVWADLPRSPVGKLLRREVREKFWTDSWRAV